MRFWMMEKLSIDDVLATTHIDGVPDRRSMLAGHPRHEVHLPSLPRRPQQHMRADHRLVPTRNLLLHILDLNWIG
jgi:hypothetical protein